MPVRVALRSLPWRKTRCRLTRKFTPELTPRAPTTASRTESVTALRTRKAAVSMNEGGQGRRQEFQQGCVDAHRVGEGAEVRTGVVIKVDGSDPDRPDLVTGLLGLEQEVEFVLVALAGDAPEPREHRRRVAPEPGLGVGNVFSGGQPEQPAGGGVAKLAAGRDVAAEAAGAQDHRVRGRGQLFGDPEDVFNAVLAVAVCADHVPAREAVRDEAESRLQRVSLAPVSGIAYDRAPEPRRRRRTPAGSPVRCRHRPPQW